MYNDPLGDSIRQKKMVARRVSANLYPTYMSHVERGEKNLSLLTMARISDGLGMEAQTQYNALVQLPMIWNQTTIGKISHLIYTPF